MHDDVLFWNYEWFDVAEAQKRAAQKDVDELRPEDFEGQSIDEITEIICEKYSLVPPQLDTTNTTVKPREVQIDVSHDRMRHFRDGGPHYVKGTAIDVRVPFNGDAGMFNVKPNTWTTSIPRGRVEGNSIVFTISGTDLTQEKVKASIDRETSEIQKWLGFQEKSVDGFSQQLELVVRQAIEVRKTKLSADADLISGLGYRIE